MTTPSIARVKEVFEQWAMYDSVIQADYMRHVELVAALAAWARKHHQPLRIVDLGCGDAWMATHAFCDAQVEQYRGVDVSESAVERARERIAIWPAQAEVVAGNLAEFLNGLPDQSANVVLASYSLHHFLSDAKDALIADCHRILVPGGTFFWVDAVCQDDETRNAYIERLTHTMELDWPALTKEQRVQACAHVRESDFPETARWMREHVEKAGFRIGDKILSDEFFAGWALVRC
ncbi:MAG TPA: class I SAM-dependent methyltransferase [Lacipirellulaceae bacterium]|jgi:ubiquinone/menaquinone biosynthesis C-methylase UbiE